MFKNYITNKTNIQEIITSKVLNVSVIMLEKFVTPVCHVICDPLSV